MSEKNIAIRRERAEDESESVSVSCERCDSQQGKQVVEMPLNACSQASEKCTAHALPNKRLSIV